MVLKIWRHGLIDDGSCVVKRISTAANDTTAESPTEGTSSEATCGSDTSFGHVRADRVDLREQYVLNVLQASLVVASACEGKSPPKCKAPPSR
jgi:hypothetical protein